MASDTGSKTPLVRRKLLELDPMGQRPLRSGRSRAPGAGERRGVPHPDERLAPRSFQPRRVATAQRVMTR